VQGRRSQAQQNGMESDVIALEQEVARLRQIAITLMGR
jgi:hypothetical protein